MSICSICFHSGDFLPRIWRFFGTKPWFSSLFFLLHFVPFPNLPTRSLKNRWFGPAAPAACAVHWGTGANKTTCMAGGGGVGWRVEGDILLLMVLHPIIYDGFLHLRGFLSSTVCIEPLIGIMITRMNVWMYEQNLIQQLDPSSTAEWGIFMIAKIENPSYQLICTGGPFFCGSCLCWMMSCLDPLAQKVHARCWFASHDAHIVLGFTPIITGQWHNLMLALGWEHPPTTEISN